jgi:opacity protein-like surface antigen
MNRKFIVSAVTVCGFMVSTSAFAAEKDGVYVTLGATNLSSEVDLSDLDVAGQNVDFGSEDISVIMLTGRLGYRLNDFFAVEGEAGFGLGGDDFERAVPVNVQGTTINVNTNVDLTVDNYFAGFARGIFPVSEQFDIFARLGYGQATAKADIVASAAGLTTSGSAEEDADGLAYGVGAQFNFTDHDGIRADYTRLDDTNIISIAYSRRF